MSHLLSVAITILAIFSATIAKADEIRVLTPTRGTPVYYEQIFVPHGLRSGDTVEIVGEGSFRHTCYRHIEPTAFVDTEQKKIILGPVAYEYVGLCIQMILPFRRVIDVGQLFPGDWTIVQGPEEEELGEISIAE